MSKSAGARSSQEEEFYLENPRVPRTTEIYLIYKSVSVHNITHEAETSKKIYVRIGAGPSLNSDKFRFRGIL